MSKTEIKELVATLLASQVETDRRMQETDRRMKETDRMIKELGRQIGGLGNKFGSFTEGLCYESCRRILRKQFGMENIEHEVEIERRDGTAIEFDMVGHTNGERNEGIIVEIKSHLGRRDIEQTVEHLKRAKEFLPQLRDCKVRALVAAVYLPKGIEHEVRAAGLHLAVGGDENFSLIPDPPDFKPLVV